MGKKTKYLYFWTGGLEKKKKKKDSSGRIFHNFLEQLFDNTETSTLMDSKIIIACIS